MKMKSLLVGGMLALALMLGTGTSALASSSPTMIRFSVSVVGSSRTATGTATPTPGGADSTTADQYVGVVVLFALSALEEAEATGNQAAIGLAYDTYVAALLVFLIVDGYNNEYFSLSEINTGVRDPLADVLQGQSALLGLEQFASILVQTGNASAKFVLEFAAIAYYYLELAIENDD